MFMKRTAPTTSTKDRILDAAEALFADAGYDGVSLRQITRAAGVELALANYHFGPKSELFLAVVQRRAAELNRERMALLAALPDPPTIEGLIDAFARPFMEKSLRGGTGRPRAAALCWGGAGAGARAESPAPASSPRWRTPSAGRRP